MDGNTLEFFQFAKAILKQMPPFIQIAIKDVLNFSLTAAANHPISLYGPLLISIRLTAKIWTLHPHCH